MQDDSAPSRTFLHRTNLLAARKGVKAEDLPDFIGIGRRTFFECRSADSKVSAKSWAKLEVAESKVFAKSAKSADPPGFAESSAYPKDYEVGESANMMRDEPASYRTKPRAELTLEQRLAKLEADAGHLPALMERIANALEEIVRNQRKEKP